MMSIEDQTFYNHAIGDQTFYNHAIDKSVLKRLIGELSGSSGHVCTTYLLDRIKHLGFEYSTHTAVSLGIDDLLTPSSKDAFVQDAEHQARISEKNYRIGNINAIEKLRQIVETWHTTSEFLKREMTSSFNVIEALNPVHMMSFSGARGNTSQVHQLVGMRGLMSDPQGRIIDLPIQTNLREGLSITEYIISCYGARKGVVDTAIRTADAGYLTRRLVLTAQYLVIRHIDCGTFGGVCLYSVQNKQGYRYISCQDRLVGRVLSRSVNDSERCIGIRNQDIGIDLAKRLISFHEEKVQVRSALTCKSATRICQLCYGWNSNYGRLVQIGEAIGVVAGQSIGEPGTQLTLRTFHTGGVFTEDIANHIRTPFNGMVYFEELMCQLIRSRYGILTWKCLYNVSITIIGTNKRHVVNLPYNSLLFVANNQYVESKQVIAEIGATQIPLKERVRKRIDSKFEGTIFYNQTLSGLSRSNKPHVRLSTNSLAVNNTGHVWVLSGRLYQFSKQWMCSLYHIQDYLEVGLPIAKLRVLTHQNGVLRLRGSVIQSSILYSSKLYDFILRTNNNQTLFVQDFKSRFGGIFLVSNCITAKDPDILCFVTLSSIDQFRWYLHDRYNTLEQVKSVSFNLTKTNLNMFYLAQNETCLTKTNMFKQTKCSVSNKWNQHVDLKSATNTLTFLIWNTSGICSRKKKCVFFGHKKHTLFLATIGFIYSNVVLHTIINNHTSLQWCLNNEGSGMHIVSYSDIRQCVQSLNDLICMLKQSCQLPRLGTLISQDKHFVNEATLTESGKVIVLQKSILILRLAQSYLITADTRLYACYDEGVDEQEALMTLIHEQLRASDIIQGLPKAVQLLESRSKNHIGFTLQHNFQNWIDCLSDISQSYILSTERSLHKIQVHLVDRIQTVYLSQGVRISDKHVEIMVRQMTCKVLFVENICHVKYNPVILPGELVQLLRAKRINRVFKLSIPYKPILSGITKASLNMDSFLAAASFQRTTRVLAMSALKGRIDWIKGLQENALFGGFISAGTGCTQITVTIKASTFFLLLQRKTCDISPDTFATRLFYLSTVLDLYRNSIVFVYYLSIQTLKNIRTQIIFSINQMNDNIAI